jgi:hypothetical protein
MKKLNIIKMLHKPVHPIVTISAVIGVVHVIGASPFITRALNRFNFSFSAQPKITYVHVTPIPNITAAPNVPTVTLNQHTFTSDELGIRFDYQVDIAGVQKFTTKQIGNNVYLYFVSLLPNGIRWNTSGILEAIWRRIPC